MSLAQICVIVAATAVPFFLWGYKRGYRKATADTYGPDTLMDSAVDLALKDSTTIGIDTGYAFGRQPAERIAR
jgi:hypothetical protein